MPDEVTIETSETVPMHITVNSSGDHTTLTVPEFSQGGRYALYTVFCSGDVLPEWLPSASALTKEYSNRLISGLDGVNMQPNPFYQPYHVRVTMAVFRGTNGLIRHKIASQHFECDHDCDLSDPFYVHLKEILLRDHQGGFDEAS